VKKCQKAGFLRQIRSKITLAKEKDRRKRNSEEEERRRGEKKAMVFYIGNSFWRTKNCLREEVYLAVTFSKIQLDICTIY